ncbi:hypothetical protein, unknown function [Leishmania mexicana MHOM/GT/2001/U1103]|uniref:Uncharacterized protein n=1 Tax=Leishmania mexicana (strain MHOM/GT/2001/U1103) TaxID=929439 RepID=E9AM89_LEIMU|nr:hypothetical protein, unknown function [Leishmania mexicana MHOM/GT/2001/U1103]CBZ24044.1 hypothetical protein, unknown function [Leishmania mexicana MHOM/GT/2001/U1103]
MASGLRGGVSPSVPAAQPYYNDIASIRDLSTMPLTHQLPSHSRAQTLVVDGTEVEVQSDVVSVSQAAPNLCAFQQECQSLLALLNASSCPRRVAPPPSSAVAPSHILPSPVADVDATGALAPAVRQERQPVTLPVARAPASTLSSPEESPPSPSVVSERVGVGVTAAAPAHSTTYAQLMQEVDDLASLLNEEEEGLRGQQSVASCQHSEAGATPAHGVRGDYAAPIAPLPSVEVTSSLADTPEKQRPQAVETHRRDRSQNPSLSPLLAPRAAELGHAPTSPLWAAQLLKWIIYLVERRQNALQRIQAFEDARAPGRRGACAGTVAGEAAASTPPSAIRVTEGLLQLLRSLNTETGDVDKCTATEKRHMCTRIANLLAEMTATEEDVMADLLNDAAAGATLEREITVKESTTTMSAALPPSSAVSETYRKDMMDTLTLLDQVSQENRTLKLRVEEVQGQATRLGDEVERERAANMELGKYFDQLAAENSRLTAELNEMEAKLRQAEAVAKSVSQEELLRNQLDRQTLHLRDVRAELDDVQDESNTLRKTILQLRDALKRHRAVIDLLTRRRRERERAAAAAARRSGSRCALSPRLQSPSMQRIEDILSGACDPPSSSSSSPPSEVKYSSGDDASGDSGVPSSLR